MKNVRRLAAFLVLIIIAATYSTTFAEDQTPYISLPELAWNVEFIVLEDQLFPPDESLYDADFLVVYKKFLEIVYNRDSAALDSLWDASSDFESIEAAYRGYWWLYRIDDLARFMWEAFEETGEPINDDDFEARCYEVRNLVWSADFDALDGLSDVNVESGSVDRSDRAMAYQYLKYFNENWENLLWEDLEYIIAPKGVSTEYETYIVPYTMYFCGNGEGYAVIDKNVAVYEAPDTASNVIDYLDYNILEDHSMWGNHPDFAKIRTLSGEEGYIRWEYLRAPWGLCCGFRRSNDGEWKMVFIRSLD